MKTKLHGSIILAEVTHNIVQNLAKISLYFVHNAI